MPVVKLTQSFINNLAPLPGKARTEWCCERLKSFYVESRITAPVGSGTYYVRYKDSSRKTKHLRIGTTSTLDLATARSLAKDQIAKIQLGADPNAAARKQKEVPTLRAFVEEQYIPWIRSRNRSWKNDANRIRQKALPLLGDLPMNAISRKQLALFHLNLKQIDNLSGATADHHLKLIRRIYNMAIDWDVVRENPAAKAQLFNDPNQVENYLTDEQFARLLKELHTNKNRMVCHVAILLLSTGARLNEALKATWDQFDIEQMTWKIPAINSKSKKARSVPLSESSLNLLTILQPDIQQRNGYLFVNPRTKDRLKTIHKAWSNIRTGAGVPFLRAHDLRHIFAGLLVNSGHTLYEVQNILGHANPITSQRYSALNTSTLQSAAASASTLIQAASPKPPPPALKLIKTGS